MMGMVTRREVRTAFVSSSGERENKTEGKSKMRKRKVDEFPYLVSPYIT